MTKLDLNNLKLETKNKSLLVKNKRNVRKKAESERIQVYLAKEKVEMLRGEWELSGLPTFSSYLVWKMKDKGVI